MMDRRTRPGRALRAAIGLVAAWAAVPAAAAADKDYSFPQVRIEISVEPGGDFVVDEFRTFEFEGSFTYAYVVIPLRIERPGERRAVAVTGLSVADERGRTLRTEIGEDGGEITAKWFYAARDERRTFHIRYRVGGGITTYGDVTELYWKAVGDGWERPARDVRITVTLPQAVPSRDDLRVWGHGPLTGWAEVVDERTARFSSPELAARQFFEVRVVWPNGTVTGVPSEARDLAAIRAEEEGYVRDTIARVRAAQADQERRRQKEARDRKRFLKALGYWGVWQIVGPLAWLLLFYRTWTAVGKDHRFEGLPDYVRELPSDLPPAHVQTLMREGRDVTPAAFTATLFDLARRGLLELEDRNVTKKGLFGDRDKVETTVTLRKDPSPASGLRPFEKDLVDFLFEKLGGGAAAGASFTIDELQRYLKKSPQKFQSFYRDWTKAVKAEAKPLGFLEPESLRARNRFYLLTLPPAVLTLSPVLLILALALIPTLKRRTPRWAREN